MKNPVFVANTKKITDMIRRGDNFENPNFSTRRLIVHSLDKLMEIQISDFEIITWATYYQLLNVYYAYSEEF